MTSSPVGAVGPSGPVGRSVREIRADLARRARGGLGQVHAYVRRLVADVEPLLAEVEAAHRFELAAGVEREALLAELAAMTRYADAQVRGSMRAAAERESLRGVVQAVRELADEWERKAGPESSGWQVYGPQWTSVPFVVKKLREIVAAAADAPQPEPCPNCGHREPHASRRGECPICGCDAPGPSPAVLPEKEQQR